MHQSCSGVRSVPMRRESGSAGKIPFYYPGGAFVPIGSDKQHPKVSCDFREGVRRNLFLCVQGRRPPYP